MRKANQHHGGKGGPRKAAEYHPEAAQFPFWYRFSFPSNLIRPKTIKKHHLWIFCSSASADNTAETHSGHVRLDGDSQRPLHMVVLSAEVQMS
jgi:hypothetical protein